MRLNLSRWMTKRAKFNSRRSDRRLHRLTVTAQTFVMFPQILQHALCGSGAAAVATCTGARADGDFQDEVANSAALATHDSRNASEGAGKNSTAMAVWLRKLCVPVFRKTYEMRQQR
jgi:hypothetical protein